ncbi:MAG TPA: hypothetical protein VLW17_05715 [Thermoanaerobaculaceae bacterium]|nr:hypothetical protein [Thermoanaerobaculaceae bacterium]
MRVRMIVLAAVVALGAAAIWLAVVPRRQAPAAAAGRRPVASVTTPKVRQSEAPTPTPAAPEVGRATFVLPWGPAPTPTLPGPEPEPTEAPVPAGGPTRARDRAPAPTPEVAECVAIRSGVEPSPVALGQVLVDVDAVNRCGRDLGPLDVWFEVAGYRHGDLVQTTRGHLLDPLPRDGEGHAAIALAGSYDWYDRVDVRVITPRP